MIDRLFLSHPRELGESYAEHFAVAGWFGVTMIVGGIACLAHAIVPRLFPAVGSGTVSRLHGQMVAKRAAKRQAQIEAKSIEWVI